MLQPSRRDFSISNMPIRAAHMQASLTLSLTSPEPILRRAASTSDCPRYEATTRGSNSWSSGKLTHDSAFIRRLYWSAQLRSRVEWASDKAITSSVKLAASVEDEAAK